MEQIKKLSVEAKEAAQMIGVGRSKIYELAAKPDFYPAFRIGRKLLFNVAKLQQWIDEQKGGHQYV